MPVRRISSTARSAGLWPGDRPRCTRGPSAIWSPTRIDRVQRAHRLLEDHRDLRAHDPVRRWLRRQRQQVRAVELDLARGTSTPRGSSRRWRAGSCTCPSRTRRPGRPLARGRPRRRRPSTPGRCRGGCRSDAQVADLAAPWHAQQRLGRQRAAGALITSAAPAARRSASPSPIRDRPSPVTTTARPGMRGQLPVGGDEVLAVDDHASPSPAVGGGMPRPEIAEGDDGQDVHDDVGHRVDDRLADHVGQHVPAHDPRVRQAAEPGGERRSPGAWRPGSRRARSGRRRPSRRRVIAR